MRLVYKKHSNPNMVGKEVHVGDQVRTGQRNLVTVKYFAKPHKAASEGKVTVRQGSTGPEEEFYVSVIGAEWIEREDRGEGQAIVNDSLSFILNVDQQGNRATVYFSNNHGECIQVDVVLEGRKIVVECEDLNRGQELSWRIEPVSERAYIQLPDVTTGKSDQ